MKADGWVERVTHSISGDEGASGPPTSPCCSSTPLAVLRGTGSARGAFLDAEPDQAPPLSL